MKFIVNSSCLETDFSELIDPVVCLDSIKKSEILIEEARHKQEGFNRYLKKGIGNKSDKQKKTLANIKKLFNRSNNAIKFVDDYGSMILEVERKVAENPEPEPEPSKEKLKRKKCSLELREEVINKIKNNKKI